MPSTLLSVVIPIRNRSGVRLENCLRSLRWQEAIPCDRVEIVLSDFGSAPEHREAVQRAARNYDATVHYTPTSDLWNRSRALNIGIKRANGEYTFCTDADMVFSPNFFKTLMDTQVQVGGHGLLMCQCHDLGEETGERVIDSQELEALKKSATLRPTYGMGGCQCAKTQWFHRIRGFDERYTYWGSEDKDLGRRAEIDGRVIKWITESAYMLHQWHPTAQFDKPWLVKKNRMRFKLTSWIVRKNWFGWGE
ncbi:MAG: glycosyltransferase family 2 protein [Polyangiaceae bacterium]|nr:glycosyltransferase family 2 protein [Polyangiaceae bacterium]